MPSNIHLHPEFDLPPWRSLLERLPEVVKGLPREQLIQGGRNDIHWFEQEGLKVVVKRFVNGGLWKKIAYRISTSKARRSFEHSEALLAAGLNAPAPIAWREDSSGSWLKESYFLCAHVNVVAEARAIRRNRTINWEPHLRKMGAAIGRMHDAGILHLDLTPGNLLLVDDGGPDWSLYFVDNNRMRFGPVDFRAGIGSILQCGVKGDDVSAFVDTYAEQRRYDPERCRAAYAERQSGHRLKWKIKNATRPWRRKLGV